MQTRDIDAVAGPSGAGGAPAKRAPLMIETLPQRSGAVGEVPVKDLDATARARLLGDFWAAVDAA
jgi:hypothetical protein